MQRVLERLGEVEVSEDGIWRVHDLRRGSSFPTVERFFVVAPVGVRDKEAARFADWWAQLQHEAGQASYPAPVRPWPLPTRLPELGLP